MAVPSGAWAWDERKALDYILDHHPVLQAQREAHAAEKLLDRLPAIDAMIGERRQAAANVEIAEANAARARESAEERAAADTRLGFLKAKSAWLQKRVAQGQPENDLWDNAQRQTAEAAALKRLDLLIESQRQQVAHLAGERWEWLYRYLSGAGGSR